MLRENKTLVDGAVWFLDGMEWDEDHSLKG